MDIRKSASHSGLLTMSKRIWPALFGMLLFSGCVSGPPISATHSINSEIIDYPAKGETVTNELGERLVAKGIRSTGPAIRISEAVQFNKAEGEKSVMTCALTAPIGTYFKYGEYFSDDVQAECFGPVQVYVSQADGSTDWNCNGRTSIVPICRDEANNYFMAAAANVRIDLKQDFEKIQLTTGVVESATNFVQELLYNGRVGDSLKFIYREFSNDIIRPAFSQEVQYDYSDSSIIGFKGLRLEVLEATNTQVTYRLIENF